MSTRLHLVRELDERARNSEGLSDQERKETGMQSLKLVGCIAVFLMVVGGLTSIIHPLVNPAPDAQVARR